MQKVLSAEIEYTLYGVEPESIDVILHYPVEHIGDEIVPHLIAIGSVKVDCITHGFIGP